MAYTSPNVYYSATLNGTYTAVNGVQSVNISRGKSFFQDPFNAASCVIELIPDATYSLPFAIGQFVDIRDSNSGSSAAYFNGKIVNIDRTYDIPYNTSTGYAPGDRIVLTVAGGTGALAGSYFTPISRSDCYYGMVNNIGGGTAYVYNAMAATLTGIPFAVPAVDIINPSGEKINWLDFLNSVMNTCQYSVDEYDMARTPVYYGGDPYNMYVGVITRPNSDATKSFTFTDNYSGAANSYKYAGIEYGASRQSIFTQVTVRPAAVAEASATSGVAPYNGIVYPTYSNSNAEAQTLANYVLAISSATSSTPFLIETSTATDDNVKTLGKLAEAPIGTAVTITFRGTTTTALLLGVNVGLYSDRMNCRFTFAPSLGTPFTLDSSAFGVLDTNRLGYP